MSVQQNCLKHKELLSVVIITYNESRNIKRCLESVCWADEIIIVDANSKDNTVEIGARYTDKIFSRQWAGYGAQRNFGLSQATCEWVLFIDADELISDSLAAEIKAVVGDNSLHDGYYLLRQSFYLGKRIQYGEWNPDWKLRLVRREKAKWLNQRVHENIILDGQAAYLQSPMYHYTYRHIGHHFKKMNLYSSLFAQDAWERREAVDLYKTISEPLLRFKKGYFAKEGFRDGIPGLVIAVLQSYEVFLRYAKLWNLKNKKTSNIQK